MRNIPLAFLDEETLDRIASAERASATSVNGFEKLAETQMAMRGAHAAPLLRICIVAAAKWGLQQLEKMMEMSGPNSIANLERAMRSYYGERDQARNAN